MQNFDLRQHKCYRGSFGYTQTIKMVGRFDNAVLGDKIITKNNKIEINILVELSITWYSVDLLFYQFLVPQLVSCTLTIL